MNTMPKKLMFTIQYNNENGESVETTSCCNDREFFHQLLDEFLDNAPHQVDCGDDLSDDLDVAPHFIVWGKACSEHK